MSDVLVERQGPVVLVTLNRPDQLNVFTAAMGRDLGAAYADCDADDDVRAVVVTGAGRAFCAGADMSADAGSFDAPSAGFSSSPIQPPAWDVRKPVIAAINGPAIGIGFTIALQCDLRVVAADAKLAIPQARRGMLGDGHSHWTLRQITSLAVAADVLLTGRTILGEEAGRLGLASRVVPAENVLPTALELAKDIAENCAPMSVALSKRLLWADGDRDAVGRLETSYHRLLMGTPDATEGPRSWVERRPPQWSARISEEWGRVE